MTETNADLICEAEEKISEIIRTLDGSLGLNCQIKYIEIHFPSSPHPQVTIKTETF